ncbi:hypothetical protein ACERIT_01640 [Halopenitus sp. H-Gu1]|uniref:hypothetical protein n=1 Tax=Halopenitus sp. H-Gu1 TaxID=3242697 RepID=UPI00359D0D0E
MSAGGKTPSDGSASEDPPQKDLETDRRAIAATPRARAKSALLWGAIGTLTFLVGLQGYLLVGAGELPISYAFAVVIACGVGGIAAVIVYLTEHRLGAKRRV